MTCIRVAAYSAMVGALVPSAIEALHLFAGGLFHAGIAVLVIWPSSILLMANEAVEASRLGVAVNILVAIGINVVLYAVIGVVGWLMYAGMRRMS